MGSEVGSYRISDGRVLSEVDSQRDLFRFRLHCGLSSQSRRQHRQGRAESDLKVVYVPLSSSLREFVALASHEEHLSPPQPQQQTRIPGVVCPALPTTTAHRLP